MALPLYLAMTAAEISRAADLPERTAYMACHFSPYSTGLSGFPQRLPEDSIIILNDRTPVHGHDPQLVAQQLLQAVESWAACAVLLDFQRPGNDQTAAVAKAVTNALSCPVGISPHYAKALPCAVFLPPPPLDCPLQTHISGWEGRDLWLEAALDGACITLTEEGSRYMPLFPPETPEPSHHESRLHCRYHIDLADNQARFTLFRTPENLKDLMQEAEQLGFTRAIGLHQELCEHTAQLISGKSL